jgi:hypothetical protein
MREEAARAVDVAARVVDAAPCPGCGLVLPDPGNVAPPHAGSSPGCWAVYGDLLAREYGEWGYPAIHRLTVDAYGAQHPGTRSAKGTQAVAAHLIALHLWLERGIEAKRIPAEMGRLVVDLGEFHWLEPPGPQGQRTVLEVAGAKSLREHRSRVEWWARSVWESWSDHHDVIRRWAGR